MIQKMMLHCGARHVEESDLKSLHTPRPTKTWYPIPHHALYQGVKWQLQAAGYKPLAEEIAVGGKQDSRLFAIIHVEANGDGTPDYGMVVGIRQSLDKRIPITIGVGARVFICDNLSFLADVVLKRKHTSQVMEDLPNMIAAAVNTLGPFRKAQDRRFNHYHNEYVADSRMHHLCIKAVDRGVLSANCLPAVLEQWRPPNEEAFAERTMWSAFNAFTQALKRYNAFTIPGRTQALHEVCDRLSGYNLN
jgi:hypothetical protein